ncbi:uncharacterized protein LOC105838152 [Monomorium pharaonis]|uniref:uncharacterized protein LOC105838152 n=1 Tax=Monomorium pharaonis TaxID=307658 RepID=UPI00063F3218|nr:uncharacterized protein LOC105838152 [Monomorium pharaonis]
MEKEGKEEKVRSLGWIVAGSSAKQNIIKKASCYLTSLKTQIAKFWTIEEIATSKIKSNEEVSSETHFANHTIRNDERRYVVHLPFRYPEHRIGDSHTVALKRLLALERKLNRDTTLKAEYTRVIEAYKTLGHMSLVACPRDDDFYMPHHAVIKQSSNTTKVRIVFDALTKSKDNVSLNDLLMVGPTVQEKLFSHLIRFRTYNYVITANIEKMYRQVLVYEDDRRHQMILWRENDEIKIYQLNMLTFGVSSSPFLTIRAVQQLAVDDGHLFPKAAAVLKQHLYVDDLLTGANSVQKARELRDEIIALLRCGGFAIRQWASNDTRVVQNLSNNALHANYVLGDDQSLKMLGISWNTRNDKICYYAREIEISEILSKRKILSEIAKIYDPLG